MVDSPKLQLAAWVVATALAAVAAVKLLAPAAGKAPPVRVERPTASPDAGRGGWVYVHVAGAVRRPGLYRLASGARVAVAIERARGPAARAELAAVNLAARVQDGQQIVVPRRGERPAAGAGAAGASAGTKLSLATATPEQLDGLDGIGPTLAKRIVEYREAHGGFSSIGELREVEGIGEKRFAALRDAVQP